MVIIKKLRNLITNYTNKRISRINPRKISVIRSVGEICDKKNGSLVCYGVMILAKT